MEPRSQFRSREQPQRVSFCNLKPESRFEWTLAAICRLREPCWATRDADDSERICSPQTLLTGRPGIQDPQYLCALLDLNLNLKGTRWLHALRCGSIHAAYIII
jgi:hypothetical protein